MTPDDWQQVKALFHSALEIAPSERAAYLDEACMGQERLREEVELLIAAHERTGSFIDSPAYERAAKSLLAEEPELKAGQRVGSYEILSQLGRGGMGEVYLAQDQRLSRKVALKLLPSAFTQDKQRLRRFEQEAQTASALNHPNIITIYNVDEADQLHFIATEYVEGETLRERLARGHLSLDETLHICIQVADALFTAHKSGIIHRDIKPENIMLREDGYVKVLDFGLAKLTKRSEALDIGAPTRARVKTETGLVMGTVSYMSPEQARGLAVDERADVWSLGCVLQEMITGQPPFAGPTAGDTIVNILEHEAPPLSEHSPDAPAELQRIVRKALRKDLEERYQSAKDMLIDLRNLRREIDLAARAASSGTHSFIGSMRKRNRIALIALAAVLVALIAVGIYRLSSQRESTRSERGEQAVVLKTMQVTTWPGLDLYPVISPDGNAIAYTSDRSGNFEVYVKPLTPGASELQLTSDGQQNYTPAWSPDGKFIAYSSRLRRGIWVVPASGGNAKQITEFGGRPAWSPDGSLIVFQSSIGLGTSATDTGAGAGGTSNLWIVSSQGGEARPLTRAGNPVGGHGNPSWSPDGKRIVFVVSGASAHTDIWNISADGADLRRVTNQNNWMYHPIYAPDGRHIYYGGVSETGNFVLYKLAVSPTSGEAVGEPVEIFNAGLIRIKHLSISTDGKKLAYSGPMMKGSLSSVPVSPVSSEATGAPVVLTQDASYRKGLPSFSPDGQKIAFVEFRGGTNQDIWLIDTDGQNPVPVTSDPAIDWAPSWFPDNDQIAFQSNRQGKNAVWTVSLKSGRERLLVDFGSDTIGWSRFSPDGKLLAFNSNRSGATNIWIIPGAGGEPVQLTFEDSATAPCWSPDGKFVAFNMKRENGAQVGIIPSEGGAAKQLTFDDGLSWPASFSPDGDKIVFAGERKGIWNIYWVSRSTLEQKQLTHYTKRNAYVRYPSWSPSGNRIVYEYTETTSNIWLMELK